MAPTARPDVRRFLDGLNALAGPRLHEMTHDAARAAYRSAKDLTELPIGDLAVQRDLVFPSPAGELRARLFDAAAVRGPGPVVVFFHGGGFVLGDLDTHAALCAAIARGLDLPVVAVDYRLAPEHRWPAAPGDAEAAARWIAASPAALGLDVTGLVLVGDSAGGTLAIITAAALRDAPAAAAVLCHAPLYPATDPGGRHPSMRDFAEGHLLTRGSLAWFANAYRADPADPRAAAMLIDPAGMPPALVLTAGLDPLRDEGRAYAARLIGAGVPVTYREAAGTVHGFATMRRALPSAVDDIDGFLAALKPMVTGAAR